MLALLLQQFVEGLAVGAIYASLGLALTLIHRSTGILNFAQGEMAMFSTFLTWQLVTWHVPMFASVLTAVAVSMAGGAAIERLVIRRVQQADHLTIAITTFGLLLVFNSLAGFIWGFILKPFPAIVPERNFELLQVRVSSAALGTIAVLAAEALLLYLVLMKTRFGLAMRAAASNTESGALSGIRVDHMFLAGWALAAAVGAMAGILVAPRVFLDPGMMSSILIFSFAGAALGGLSSPMGAVIGCLLVGVVETLAGTLIPGVADLRMLVPLTLIIFVLLLKPEGLFGARTVVRV